MKNILWLLLSVLFLQACNNPSHIEDRFILVLEQSNDSTMQKAANQLATYWKAVTQRDLLIQNTCSTHKTGIYLGNHFASDSMKASLSPLKKDAFIISIKQDSILLFGLNSLSTLYAVNTFLEEQLGCVKLSESEDLIPKMDAPSFNDFYKIYNPAFDFRRILFKGQKNQAFREWYKLDELDDWGMFVHTFQHLISPEKYYQEHPEYFSLVNGRRLQDAQLCLSNPEVIQVLIENLGEEMKKQPEKTIWSVSQNDTYNYCECENCQKLYEQYASYSGAYIHMANQIARAYPDKQISTLAYQFTRSAPENIQPLPNVNIMFCSIECNRSMPLAKDPRSQDFVKDMKDWSALTSNIFMWDYVVQFKNYLTPFPNFLILQPNIQFFEENKVNMMFQQGSSGNWSDLSELKQFLIAKLLWNPNANVDSLASHFLQLYYQDAAPFIEKYYEKMNQEIQNHASEEVLNIYGFPSDYVDSYLSPDLMLFYLSLMDSAQQAVAHDSLLLNRVKRARLPVDFAFVDIAINHHLEKMPSIISKLDKKEINPLIIKLLDNMEAYAAIDPSIKINERNFEISDYKTYVLDKLNAQLKPNKMDHAQLKCQTKYSDIYPVGGEKALKDHLFGSLDYHQNWLSFQGEDMILDIDFLEATEISEIQMNFMKAVNSWIFLPKKVLIEASDDGEHFEQIQSFSGDTEDQNYLVKSIPFVFHFDKIESRYIRITAESLKTCPEWHRGFGKPSWIFIDEIIIN